MSQSTEQSVAAPDRYCFDRDGLKSLIATIRARVAAQASGTPDISLASTTSNGLMSAADKKRLNELTPTRAYWGGEYKGGNTSLFSITQAGNGIKFNGTLDADQRVAVFFYCSRRSRYKDAGYQRWAKGWLEKKLLTTNSGGVLCTTTWEPTTGAQYHPVSFLNFVRVKSKYIGGKPGFVYRVCGTSKRSMRMVTEMSDSGIETKKWIKSAIVFRFALGLYTMTGDEAITAITMDMLDEPPVFFKIVIPTSGIQNAVMTFA